jgi:hypothetical protein
MERDYFRRQVQRYLAGLALSSDPKANYPKRPTIQKGWLPKEANDPKQTARQII